MESRHGEDAGAVAHAGALEGAAVDDASSGPVEQHPERDRGPWTATVEAKAYACQCRSADGDSGSGRVQRRTRRRGARHKTRAERAGREAWEGFGGSRGSRMGPPMATVGTSWDVHLKSEIKTYSLVICQTYAPRHRRVAWLRAWGLQNPHRSQLAQRVIVRHRRGTGREAGPELGG